MLVRIAKRFRPSGAASSWGRTLSVSVVVGVLSGLAAAALEAGLHYGSAALVGRFTHAAGADVFNFHWGVLLLPAIGGLASGVVVTTLFRIRPGHGVDAYTRAFHRQGGRMEVRGPLVRATAAVGVISCGGSAGPEGPISALGASIGSAVSGRLGLTPRERRMFLVAGCAGGVGAVFQCPLGGALFAANVLYREPEFEHRALVPALVSSVVAYSTFMALRGFGNFMLAGASTLAFTSPVELLPYLALGVACASVSIFFYHVLRALERLPYARARIGAWLSPALGGLAVGLLACALPQVMDGQYGFVQNALDGRFFEAGADSATWLRWAAFFGVVTIAKCAATALTVGTGGSGGVLGPSVFVGGTTGAAIGALFEALMPGTFPEALRRALIPVGMGGVLAAAMRVPLPAIVMVTEMTGSYGLIVPLMLVCAVSYVLGRRWGLNEEQVRSAVESPAHAGDAVVSLLETTRVADVMERDWSETAQRTSALSDLVRGLRVGTRPHIAVLDGRRLVGVISVGDIRRVAAEGLLADAIIAEDLMTSRPAAATATDDLYHAARLLRQRNLDALPVVDGQGAFAGMLTREAIRAALHRRLTEMREHLLEEHAGVAAIEQEEQVQSLLAGLPAAQRGTVQRMNVPAEIAGRSLKEADFRAAYRCEVVAVQTGDGRTICPPDPNRALAADDLLVVISLAAEE